MLPYAPPKTKQNTPSIATTRSSPAAVASTVFKALLMGAVAMFIAPIVIGFLFFILLGFESNASQESGPAPTGTVSERRAWGKERLRDFFTSADEWAHESSQIAADIGEVTSVAPIGAPNSYGRGFGEAWASLNLQVIGTRGEGVLFLPDAKPNDDAAWIFEGHAYPVFESGESWLDQNELKKEYSLVVDMAEQENHAGVIWACEQLEYEADKKFGVTSSNSQSEPQFVSLPMAYRTQVQKALATSLIANKNQRSEFGVQAFNISLEAAEAILSELLEQQRDCEFSNSESQSINNLEQVNEFLKLAANLAPESRCVQDLASIRAMMAYQLQCGCFLREDSGLGETAQQNRRRKILQGMFVHAKKFAQQSPYLKSELGEVKIKAIDSRYLPASLRRDWSALPKSLQTNICNLTMDENCQMRLSQDARFSAYFTLQLVGENGTTGCLRLLIKEHVDQANQRDLFLEEVSGPSDSFTLSEIRWTESGKRKIKLSPSS